MNTRFLIRYHVQYFVFCLIINPNFLIDSSFKVLIFLPRSDTCFFHFCCFQKGFFETKTPQYTRFTFQYSHEDTDWELEEDFVKDIFQNIASSSVIDRFVVRHCKGDTEFAHNLHAFFVTKEPTTFPEVPLLLHGTLEPALKDEEFEFNNVINCRCSLNHTILKQNIL